MKKRLASIVLVLAILWSLLPTAAFAAAQAPFKDVAATAWYYDAVSYVYEKGIMSGIGNGSFSPETTLTRAQLCQILYNMEGQPTAGNSSFTDVGAASWYVNAVSWAAANSIVNGTGSGRFSPNLPIPREQVVTILYRYANYKGYNLSVLVSVSDYSDADRLSAWAEDAMKWAVSEQIISGTTSTTISPQGTTTRAQAATMLMRFCQRMEAKEAFYAKDIDDFAGETVINFDASDETNFAVLMEDTVAAESAPSTNVLVSSDENEGIYVFSHIDQTISSLTPGDVLYITYGTGADDYLLFKVGSIELNGDTATVTEGEAELSDYFQYIDVDMEVALSQTENDVSFQQNNIAPALLASMQDPNPLDGPGMVTALLNSDSTPDALARGVSGSAGTEFEYGLKGDNISLTGKAKLTLQIKISYDRTILNLDEISVSIKTETSVNFEVSKSLTSDKAAYKKNIGTFTAPVTTGVDAEVAADFKVELKSSVNGSASGTITMEKGVKFSDGKTHPINETNAGFDVDIGGSFNVSAGIDITGSVVVMKILRVSVGVETGIELDGKLEVFHADTQSEVKHLCGSCVDGTIGAFWEVSYKIKVGISEKHSLTPLNWKVAKVKIELSKFYISFLGGSSAAEFGWGTCPHKQYLLTVTAVDQFGGKVSGARILVTDTGTNTHPVPEEMTGADGTCKVYCGNGSYRITGYGPDGYQDASEDVTISGKAQAVTLVMEKEIASAGIMTCDVYGPIYLYENPSPDNVVGTATMKILSDKEAVFSMKLTRFAHEYCIDFGTWDLQDWFKVWTDDDYWAFQGKQIFKTGYDVPSGSWTAWRNDDWSDMDSFTISDTVWNWTEGFVEGELSWTVTASNAGDFSFYDLEETTMIAYVYDVHF